MNIINKMPRLLRWVLFLPAALVSALIIYIPFALLEKIVIRTFPGTDDNIGFLIMTLVIIAGHFVQAYVFVWSGSAIAPRNQLLSKVLVLAVIVICLGAAIKNIQIMQSTNSSFFVDPRLALACIFAIIGGFTAAYITMRRQPVENKNILTNQ